MPILDREGRLVAILANDESWPEQSREGAEALEEARGPCKIPAKGGRHRRRQFVALRCGVSHGGGQKVPGNPKNISPNDEVVANLNQKEPFQRISGFATSVLATWMLELHAHYADTLKTLHNHDLTLKCIFPTSVFFATTYNPLDPKKGGHLILWDCGLVVEFPPGSTILIPSRIPTSWLAATSIDTHSCNIRWGGIFAG